MPLVSDELLLQSITVTNAMLNYVIDYQTMVVCVVHVIDNLLYFSVYYVLDKFGAGVGSICIK